MAVRIDQSKQHEETTKVVKFRLRVNVKKLNKVHISLKYSILVSCHSHSEYSRPLNVIVVVADFFDFFPGDSMYNLPNVISGCFFRHFSSFPSPPFVISVFSFHRLDVALKSSY